ncbi:MAG: hypothetical protein WAV05_16940, partial [Anaerolineales bacterium]
QCFQFELLRVFPVVPVVHICSPDLFSLPDQDIFCVHFFAQFHYSHWGRGDLPKKGRPQGQ